MLLTCYPLGGGQMHIRQTNRIRKEKPIENQVGEIKSERSYRKITLFVGPTVGQWRVIIKREKTSPKNAARHMAQTRAARHTEIESHVLVVSLNMLSMSISSSVGFRKPS